MPSDEKSGRADGRPSNVHPFPGKRRPFSGRQKHGRKSHSYPDGGQTRHLFSGRPRSEHAASGFSAPVTAGGDYRRLGRHLPGYRTTTPLPRPHLVRRLGIERWRGDLKWALGIPFTVVLTAFLFTMLVFQFSSQSQAESTISAMSRPVLANAQLQQELVVLSPDLYSFINSAGYAGSVYQNPSLLQQKVGNLPDVTVSAEGREASASSVGLSDPAGIRTTVGLYGIPLWLMSGTAHDIARTVLIVLAALLLALGIPFILLGRRLGRLVNAGASLAVASWLPLLVISLAGGAISNWLRGSGDTGGIAQQQLLQDSVKPFTDGFVTQALALYRPFAFAAAALLVAAGIAWLTLGLQRAYAR